MAEHTDVMISSTARDLPVHRQQAQQACLRQGMHPVMMEHLPASSSEAISASLKMVDDAEIYLGIFGFRYGYVPDDPRNPDKISITEMEYRRALEHGDDIERMIFIMSDEHDIKGADVEKGDGAAKLEAFKERMMKENIVNFFDSPDDLRAKIIDSLSKSKARMRRIDHTKVHAPLDIPAAPEPFTAPRYTFLGQRGLIGRQKELNLLTDWVANPNSRLYSARMLHIVAIGGMGKSALTWKWFDEIAPQEMPDLRGRVWWSFYESDGHFENFVIRTLAYVSQTHTDEVRKLPPPERENRLLNILDTERHLIVLDGLERILIAYARMDAAYLADDEYDEQTANHVAGAIGLPESAAQSFTGQHRLRKTADPRAGNFLRRLCAVRNSRILVSTRLFPVDLQSISGEPLRGNFAIFLNGLDDDDALNLWRASGATGTRGTLLPLLNSFDNYPLLIRALAGEVNHARYARGDFDRWHERNPNFNPALLPLAERKSHVLSHALTELGDEPRRVLRTLAGFRAPTDYDTLYAVLVGAGGLDAAEMDDALTELEDRGLVGWDVRHNRYDLHPITRGVVWGGLDDDHKRDVYAGIESHFQSVPMIDDWQNVESLDDLTPAIELYHALIGQGRYDDAGMFFYQRLNEATHFRLSASRQRIELLERLFPDGLDQLPRWGRADGQSFILNALAQGYQFSGQPGKATPLFRLANDLDEERGDMEGVAIGLGNISDALRLSGGLREAESSARRRLDISRELADRVQEGVSLGWLGLALAARGAYDEGESVLSESLSIFQELDDKQAQGVVEAYIAQAKIWRGDAKSARTHADRAWELAGVARYEKDFIRSARLQGEAALLLDDLTTADERLHHALTRARAVNLAEEELPALVALAEMARRRGKLDEARELLADVWDAAEAGPYPLIHADARVVLARVEQDAGDIEAARSAAEMALALARCDGGEYVYEYGQRSAREVLAALG